MAANFFDDNRDIQFNFDKFINWQKLVPLKEKDFEDYKKYQETQDDRYAFAPSNVEEGVENYRAILQQIGELSARELWPIAKILDEKSIHLENGKVILPEEEQKVLDLFIDNGLIGFTVSRDNYGQNMPNAAFAVLIELLARGDSGIFTLFMDLGFTLERFADEEIIKKYVPKMAQGLLSSAMALTEPNYGSDLSNVKMQAKRVEGEKNKFILNGTKMFITNGQGSGKEGGVILTLARSLDKPGARGLSFFLVESKDVEVTKVEHKLGLHSSPTCELVYDNVPGYLIGEEGKGLTKYAIYMMYEARLHVSAQAVGIAQAAYDEAASYAEQRIQFGKPIKDIPAVKRMLKDMKTYLEAIRALVYKTAEIVDIGDALERKLLAEGKDEREVRKDPEVNYYINLSNFLTPLTKYVAAEVSNKIAYDAIQVHGGVGYTEEYNVARLYRDARITPIYEGTSQLQVVAAIASINAGLKENGFIVKYFDELESQVNLPDEFNKYLDAVKEMRTKALEMMEKYKAQDRETKDTYAKEMVELVAAIIMSYLMLIQATLDENNEYGKRDTAKYFIEEAKAWFDKDVSLLNLRLA